MRLCVYGEERDGPKESLNLHFYYNKYTICTSFFVYSKNIYKWVVFANQYVTVIDCHIT